MRTRIDELQRIDLDDQDLYEMKGNAYVAALAKFCVPAGKEPETDDSTDEAINYTLDIVIQQPGDFTKEDVEEAVKDGMFSWFESLRCEECEKIGCQCA